MSSLQKHMQEKYNDLEWDMPQPIDKCNNVEEFTYHKSQRFLTKYLKNNNQKGMLLMHSVGVGKTCGAILAASAVYELEGYNILWVTRGSLRENMWKNIFDTICHVGVQGSIDAGEPLPNTRKLQKKFLRKITKSWKDPLTYRQFSNMMKGYFKGKYNDNLLSLIKSRGTQDVLKKTLIIIDEAHKLYGSSLSIAERPDMKWIEQAINHSYKTSGNDSVKVLLLSATPIEEKAVDGLRLLNLLLPIGKKFDIRPREFVSRYFNNQGTNFTSQGRKQFMKHVEGLISYLDRSGDISQFAKQIYNVITITNNVHRIAGKMPFHDVGNCTMTNIKKYFLKELLKYERLQPLIKASVFKLDHPNISHEHINLIIKSCQQEFLKNEKENKDKMNKNIEEICQPMTTRNKNNCIKEQKKISKESTKENRRKLKECDKEYKKSLKNVSKQITEQCKRERRDYESSNTHAIKNLKTLEKCGFNEKCLDRKSIIFEGVYKFSIDNSQFNAQEFKRDLPKVSPKLEKLLRHIEDLDTRDQQRYHKKFKHLIFTRQHIKLVIAALVADGKKFLINGQNQIIRNPDQGYQNVLGLISGIINYRNLTKGNIKKQLDIFNKRPDNIYGKNARFLVIDSKFTEGIDVFDIKYIHILQRPKSNTLLKQIIGRGTRLCGQKGLPFEENVGWPLHIFQYELQQPNSKNLNEMINYDAKIVELSKIDKKQDAMITVMKESAIDRLLNRKINNDQVPSITLPNSVDQQSQPEYPPVPPQNTYINARAQRRAELDRNREIRRGNRTFLEQLQQHREQQLQDQQLEAEQRRIQQQQEDALLLRVLSVQDLAGNPLPLSAKQQIIRYTNQVKDVVEMEPHKRTGVQKKEWYKICNNPIDIIMQMDWEDDDIDDEDNDIIFIDWPNGKTECYNANHIKRFLKEESTIAVDWVENPQININNIPESERNQGVGYYPDPNGMFYIKIWPLNDYITIPSLVEMFKSKERHFKAKFIHKKRLGNILGSRGVSRLHGQKPFEKIHKLVPKMRRNSS